MLTKFNVGQKVSLLQSPGAKFAPKFALLCGVIAVQAMLAGCGGGGGDGAAAAPVGGGSGGGLPGSSTGTNPTTGATATLTGAASVKTAWHAASAMSVSLKDGQGNALTGVTCAPADATKLTVAADCSSVSGLRLGTQQIVVTSGANSANVSVTVTPQRAWVGAATNGSPYNAVVLGNGNVAMWGSNDYSLLDQNKSGNALASSNLPLLALDGTGLAPLAGIAQVSAGPYYAYALSNDGSIWSWGSNVVLPTRISNSANTGSLTNVVQVAAGTFGRTVLLDDGSVLSWGSYTGQGSSNTAAFAAPVVKADGTPLTNIVSVSTGYDFALALDADGRVWSWGDTYGGHTGNGTTASGQVVRATTVKLGDGNDLTGAVSISAGYNFSTALTDKGTVATWGENQFNQLGQGASTLNSGVAIYVQNALGTGPSPVSRW